MCYNPQDRLYSIEYTNKEAIQLLKQAHEKGILENCMHNEI